MVGDGGGNGSLERDLGEMAVVSDRLGMLLDDDDEEDEELVWAVDLEVGFRRDKNDCLAGRTWRLVVDCDMLTEVGSGGTSSRRASATACTAYHHQLNHVLDSCRNR